MNEWIDVHAHFGMLESSVEETIDLCSQNGVKHIINIGTNPEDNPQVLRLAEKYSPQIYCTLGMHPHDAKLYSETFEAFLLENLDHQAVLAVGEIGLDFYYLNSDKDIQEKVFRRQIEIAVDKNLPIEIHTRDAEDETLKILNEFKGRVKGLVHCFSGSEKLMNDALMTGLNISISGIVTFKKAEELRRIVKLIPLDRIHIETDSPFLSPVPHRGKKNTPAYVVHVAEEVAKIYGISLEQLAKQTKENALKLFPKLIWAS